MYTGPEYHVIMPRRDRRTVWLNGYRWTTELTPNRPGYRAGARYSYVRLPDGVTLPAGYLPATAGMDGSRPHGRREAIRTAIARKITMGDEYVCNGWCCTDCLMYLANGDEPTTDYLTENDIARWRDGFRQHTDGYNVVLGMFAADHECAYNWIITGQAGQQHYYRAKDIREALDEHEWHNDLSEVVSAESCELATHDDCECEQNSFSWSSCDVCGSDLGGSRDAVTFWKILYR